MTILVFQANFAHREKLFISSIMLGNGVILSYTEIRLNMSSKFSFLFEDPTQEYCLFLNILYDNLLRFPPLDGPPI